MWAVYLPLQNVQTAAPTTGQTVTVNPNVTALHINPAGTLATLTVTLPSNPVDGQGLLIGSAQIITALTVSGGTIVGALTTLALGGFAYFVYNASGSKWYRCG